MLKIKTLQARHPYSTLLPIALVVVLLATACGSAGALPTGTQPPAAPPPTQALAPTTAPAESQAPPALVENAAPAPTAAIPQAVDPQAAMLPAARADLEALPDLSDYRIDLQIEPSLARFTGSLQVDYTNLESTALDRVYFRLLPNGGKTYGNGALGVGAVLAGGQAVEPLSPQGDASVLEIPLAAPLQPGESIRFEMTFTGDVPEDFGGGEDAAGYGIYNLTGGVLALSAWYPILAVYDEDGWNLDPVSAMGDSVYSDTAYYTVNICAPPGLVLAATGVETGRRQTGDAACALYESGPTRDFMLMAGRDFERLTATVDGVAVNSYYLPGHAAAGQTALDISAKSLEIYNEKFGPYPFTELDVVDTPMRHALGVEFPGIILVSTELYDQPDREDFFVATAHEVAHQWWYSVIGNDVFEEPWLDEALTTFSSSLYYEYGRSPNAARGLWEFWQERYDRLVESGRDGPVAESLAYFEADPATRVYSGVVYTKGGLFFHALRREIGDEAFFSALRQYYSAHKYAIARGQDLLDAFETAAGRQLDPFYQEWLFAQ